MVNEYGFRSNNTRKRLTQMAHVALGDISISGTLIKANNLAGTFQVCADCGAKKVLIPVVSIVAYLEEKEN